MTSTIDREQAVYEAAYRAAIDGADCSFWPTNGWRTAVDAPKWDAEQYTDIFVAVKRACGMPGTAADRWQVVVDALRWQAHKYADYVASER